MTKRLIIGIVVAVILCALGIAVQVVHRRRIAETFLAEASTMQLRVATLAQIQQLAARYGGQVDPTTCDSGGCAYFFSFDNGWLHRLYLAPYTRFTCTLGPANGVLVYRRMLLISGNVPTHSATVEEWLDYPEGIKGLPHIEEPFDIHRQSADVSGGGALASICQADG